MSDVAIDESVLFSFSDRPIQEALYLFRENRGIRAMPEFVIPPPPVLFFAVAGTNAGFPVRRIICVGGNHAPRDGTRSGSRAAFLLSKAGRHCRGQWNNYALPAEDE
jgi:hypothetical protein